MHCILGWPAELAKLTVCPQVLGQYLAELDDLEVRYQLAMEVGMYDTALECLKGLRDRERVKSFINFVPILKHYEFRGKVDALLANSVSTSTCAVIHIVLILCPISKSSGNDGPGRNVHCSRLIAIVQNLIPCHPMYLVNQPLSTMQILYKPSPDGKKITTQINGGIYHELGEQANSMVGGRRFSQCLGLVDM